MMTARFLVAAGALAAFAGAAEAKPPIATAFYTCAEGKQIAAAYFTSTVSIILSDGRAMNLKQAVSGSGTRYTNPDDNLEFWSKGNGAFITENGGDDPTFADCEEK